MSLITTRMSVMAIFSLLPALFPSLPLFHTGYVTEPRLIYPIRFSWTFITYNRLNKAVDLYFSNIDLFEETKPDLLQMSHTWNVFDFFS